MPSVFPSHHVSPRAAALCAWAVGLAACRAGAVPALAPVGDACLVSAAEGPLRDTVTIVLEGPVRPGGDTLPASPAERFLFDHLGGSGSTLDCRGETRTGAAPSFRPAPDAPLTLLAPAGWSAPPLLLRAVPPGTDLRDQIDAGADVLITSDPAALEYARRRGDLRLVPLAWSTTYLLVAPAGILPVQPTAALRDELARDAVRAEARAAELPALDASRCARPARASGAARYPAVVVPAGDPVARGLAERVLALAEPAGPSRVLVFPAERVDSLLAAGGASAFILPLGPPRFPDCRDRPPIPLHAAVASLIEVRPTAVLRAGLPAFLILGDGVIRFLPVAAR